jgi:hypothetical protein
MTRIYFLDGAEAIAIDLQLAALKTIYFTLKKIICHPHEDEVYIKLKTRNSKTEFLS